MSFYDLLDFIVLLKSQHSGLLLLSKIYCLFPLIPKMFSVFSFHIFYYDLLQMTSSTREDLTFPLQGKTNPSNRQKDKGLIISIQYGTELYVSRLCCKTQFTSGSFLILRHCHMPFALGLGGLCLLSSERLSKIHFCSFGGHFTLIHKNNSCFIILKENKIPSFSYHFLLKMPAAERVAFVLSLPAFSFLQKFTVELHH